MKKRKSRYVLPVISVTLGLLLVVIGGARAGVVQGFWDLVADLTATKLVAQVEAPVSQDEASLGTAIYTGTESVFNCTGLKDDDSSRTRVECHSSVKLPGTGSVQPISNILTNNLGGPDIIIDSADIIATGYVSSTFSVAIFATSTPATSSTIPYNIAVNPASLGTTSTLLYKQLATSTPMQLINTLNEIQNQAASSTVIVPSGSGLHILLMNPYLNGCIPGTSRCESVTSTNRGFTSGFVDVKFHYYRDL